MRAIVTQRATTLAEERALRPDGAGNGGGWWYREGFGAPPRVAPAAARPRLAARQRALEAAAWHPTPRPGESRAT